MRQIFCVPGLAMSWLCTGQISSLSTKRSALRASVSSVMLIAPSSEFSTGTRQLSTSPSSTAWITAKISG